MPGVIRSQIESIENCEKDIAFYDGWRMEHPPADDNRAKKDEAEKRRAIRESISSAVRSNVLEMRERELMTYRGFRIILPANMTVEKPYVWLSRNGRYYVELGDTEVGNLIRIDNFLDSLGDHLTGLNEGLEKLKKKEREIEAELSKDESFAEQIEQYNKKVETIDRKLGVKKQ